MMQMMNGWAYGGLGFVFWVTILLVWAVLALLVVYLWNRIKK